MLSQSSIRALRRGVCVYRRNTLRGLSDRVPSHFRRPEHDEIGNSHVQNEFRQGFEQVASFYGRFIKYTTLSFISLASLVYISWEGCHQWVEQVELAPPPSPSDDPYQWSDELDTWTSASGGTDPKLGYRGRHAVRAAWMALHWAGEPNLNVIESSVAVGGTGGNPFDKQLHDALSHLSTALAVAYRNAGDLGTNTNREPTVMNLLALSGGILDRIASPSALSTAKPMLEEVHGFYLAEGHVDAAARLSVKLGDICAKLGGKDEAIEWWDRALRSFGVDGIRSHLASEAPPSRLSNTPTPAQQRIIASALVSLSGHYASTRQFSKACEVEMAGLGLIAHHLLPSSSPSPDKTWSTGALLHQLFLYSRATVLLMHLAEVTFAQGKSSPLSLPSLSTPTSSSLKWNYVWPWGRRHGITQERTDMAVEMSALQGAALSAERICEALTNVPGPAVAAHTLHSIGMTVMRGMHRSPVLAPGSDTSTALSSPPAQPNTALHPSFAKSRTLSKPSAALLRQSKRIAAQSFQLCGMLFEKRGKDTEAMEEYERALAWVGGGPDGRTGADAIESEWKAIWERYIKVRERVLQSKT